MACPVVSPVFAGLQIPYTPAAGYNVCIFAYGQTGSGKTHTMSGTDVEQYAGRGINYRALDDLFAIQQQRADEVCNTLSGARLLSLGPGRMPAVPHQPQQGS